MIAGLSSSIASATGEFNAWLDPCFRGNIFDHFGKTLVLGNDPGCMCSVKFSAVW